MQRITRLFVTLGAVAAMGVATVALSGCGKGSSNNGTLNQPSQPTPSRSGER